MADNAPQIPKAVHTLMQKFLGVDPALILAGLQESLLNMQRFCVHFDNRQSAIEKQLAALTEEIKKLNRHFEQQHLESIPDEALPLINVSVTPLSNGFENAEDTERTQTSAAG